MGLSTPEEHDPPPVPELIQTLDKLFYSQSWLIFLVGLTQAYIVYHIICAIMLINGPNELEILKKQLSPQKRTRKSSQFFRQLEQEKNFSLQQIAKLKEEKENLKDKISQWEQ